MWGDPGAAKAPPNNRRAFAQRNPIGRLHAQTHHAANDALTNGKPGKVPARHVPMLAARAPGLQGETIVVVYDAGRGIFSSFVGLFFASEMFPIIFNFFFCIFLSPLFSRERRRFKKKKSTSSLRERRQRRRRQRRRRQRRRKTTRGASLSFSLFLSLTPKDNGARSFFRAKMDRSNDAALTLFFLFFFLFLH